jgi:hypothetical protein
MCAARLAKHCVLQQQMCVTQLTNHCLMQWQKCAMHLAQALLTATAYVRKPAGQSLLNATADVCNPAGQSLHFLTTLWQNSTTNRPVPRHLKPSNASTQMVITQLNLAIYHSPFQH